MTDNPRKPFGGKGTMDGYRREPCGAWVEYRDLGKVRTLIRIDPL
jgi:hypothetical protein